MIQTSIDRLAALDRANMPEFRDAIIEELCQLTDSEIAYFYASNLSEDRLTLLGYSKSVMDACQIVDHPGVYKVNETGLWGDAVRQRCPVITNDYVSSTKPSKHGLPEGHVPVHSHMNLPIFADGRIVAIVGVGNKATSYTIEDAHKVEDLMNRIWLQFQDALWVSTW